MWEKGEAPLGVFDSGLGGLTVVREILQQMPHESILYYADTAHVPYGSRQPNELKGFAWDITAYLVAQKCKMVLIACNTSTSLAYDELKNSFSVPLIGVIEPGVARALEITQNRRIGVIGTEATMKSGVYQKKLQSQNSAIQVMAVACPPFVPLVEEGVISGAVVEKTVARYLRPLREKGIDTLILGCTHYPFLRPVIAQIMGPGVKIIDPASETVQQASRILRSLDLQTKGQDPVYVYVSSQDAENFRLKGSAFLGRNLGTVREIQLSSP